MAQPEIIKDINDQVSAVDPNGDTMAGTLRIQKSTWPQLLLHETTVNRHAVNEIDTDGRYVISVRGEITSGGANGTYLFLDKETQSLNNIIRFGRNINGVWEEYNLLHSGNLNNYTDSFFKRKVIANNTDWDTILTEGYYHTNYQHYCTNTPPHNNTSTMEWGLQVLNTRYRGTMDETDSGWLWQIAYPAYGTQIFTRYKVGGNAWSTWKYLLNNGDAFPFIKHPTAFDFNTATQTGFHSVCATGNTNTPHPDNHGLLIVDSDVGTDYQIWSPDNQMTLYKRWNSGGTWSAWSNTWTININGNATTSSYPLGFQHRDASNNWVNGDFTSDGFTTYITDWHEPSGGDIYWASNAGGKLAAGIDGYFYQGRDSRDYQLHRCLDTYDSATGIYNRANYANYLSNSSHNISIGSSTWGASNPWGCTNRTLVWGQSGYNSSYSADTADIVLYYGNTPASGGAGWFLHIDGGIQSIGGIYGGVWNDYAEYRKAESIEPGRVVIESADGEMKLSTERLQPGAEIISDTFGFAIGETDEYKTPIAATGRVLAYPNEDRYSYPLGCAVCSGPNGTVSQMTREEIREYPERIIGTVSEIPEYKTWGTGNVEVNGRIWIRIK